MRRAEGCGFVGPRAEETEGRAAAPCGHTTMEFDFGVVQCGVRGWTQ